MREENESLSHTPVPLCVSPNQGPYRPIRARIAQSGPVSPNQGPARRPMIGRLEEHLYHLTIREEAGGIFWVNPSSKCASCHSNEMHQRIIHTHVKVSSKAYVYDDTIYNFCARARFAGCSYLRHIILGLNTVNKEINFTVLRVFPIQAAGPNCPTVMNRQLAPYLFEIGLSILDSSPWRGGYLSYYRVCCMSHPDVFNTVFFTGVLERAGTWW